MLRYFLWLTILLGLACNSPKTEAPAFQLISQTENVGLSLVILGTLQDGGMPHIGCAKDCCQSLWKEPNPDHMVVSLGLIDKEAQKAFLIEASPDLPRQLSLLNEKAGIGLDAMPSGVFLTHAHIGHYSGLQYFGKEAKNSASVPVYAMPRMREFLTTAGPWSQLVELNNIEIKPIKEQSEVKLTEALTVIPFRVPHRDEFSETVGYKIVGPKKSALFIPDIDKWSKWDQSIIDLIKTVDYAFLDGTFYHGPEIAARDISQIPHPFIQESMQMFKDLPATEKKKIYFIHFNHTNPVLNKTSAAYKECTSQGFNIAQVFDVFSI